MALSAVSTKGWGRKPVHRDLSTVRCHFCGTGASLVPKPGHTPISKLWKLPCSRVGQQQTCCTSTSIWHRNSFNLKKSLCMQWGMVTFWQVGTRSDYRAGLALWYRVPCRFHREPLGMLSPAGWGEGSVLKGSWRLWCWERLSFSIPMFWLRQLQSSGKMKTGSHCFLFSSEQSSVSHTDSLLCSVASSPRLLSAGRSWICLESGDHHRSPRILHLSLQEAVSGSTSVTFTSWC